MSERILYRVIDLNGGEYFPPRKEFHVDLFAENEEHAKDLFMVLVRNSQDEEIRDRLLVEKSTMFA